MSQVKINACGHVITTYKSTVDKLEYFRKLFEMYPDVTDFSDLKYSPVMNRGEFGSIIYALRNNSFCRQQTLDVLNLKLHQDEYICILNVEGTKIICVSYVLRKIPYFANWLDRWVSVDNIKTEAITGITDLSDTMIDRSHKILGGLIKNYEMSDKLDMILYSAHKSEYNFYGIFDQPNQDNIKMYGMMLFYTQIATVTVTLSRESREYRMNQETKLLYGFKLSENDTDVISSIQASHQINAIFTNVKKLDQSYMLMLNISLPVSTMEVDIYHDSISNTYWLERQSRIYQLHVRSMTDIIPALSEYNVYIHCDSEEYVKTKNITLSSTRCRLSISYKSYELVFNPIPSITTTTMYSTRHHQVIYTSTISEPAGLYISTTLNSMILLTHITKDISICHSYNLECLLSQ